MGRSFTSVRMGGKAITERWERVARALPGPDRDAALRVVAMAKQHTSEGFYAFGDPLESIIFSVLVEILKGRGHGPAPVPEGAGS